MKIHGYYRSSAAYRVRIALNLKNLQADWDYKRLRLAEHRSEDFTRLNPQQLVPTLEEDGFVLSQSLAIIDYLDERHPDPPLLPAAARARARVRQLSLIPACEIHPINNLRVLQYLTGTLGLSEDERDTWYRHWVGLGFDAMEVLLRDSPDTGTYCHGDSVTLADIVLVPQVYNALRFNCDMSRYPTIARINDACLALPAFADAVPENQPDAE